MVFLFVSITLELIFDVFFSEIWANPEIQYGGPRWPPFKNDTEIMTSCDVITSSCGRQRRHFQTYYLPSQSRCHSFYILRVTDGGGGGRNPPPGRRRPKKTGLNRVKANLPPPWIGLREGGGREGKTTNWVLCVFEEWLSWMPYFLSVKQTNHKIFWN